MMVIIIIIIYLPIHNGILKKVISLEFHDNVVIFEGKFINKSIESFFALRFNLLENEESLGFLKLGSGKSQKVPMQNVVGIHS